MFIYWASVPDCKINTGLEGSTIHKSAGKKSNTSYPEGKWETRVSKQKCFHLFFGNLVQIFENEINVFSKSLCFLGSLL